MVKIDKRWTLFGAKLRVARAVADLSLRDAAAKVGLSAMALSKFENGASTPKTSNLAALARLYGVTLDWLVCSCPINLDYHEGECADGVQRRANALARNINARKLEH